ncbi:putative cytochrome P450 6a21 [Zootermopsis nevadensis]|uniref:Putative cytochrome P450 6a21 n=1 Tax=Zootermopsis nevadensis TaxID=136037 RepID=A0A067QXS9_ZOONE|nr:putative cytochrome P450 6a21 [Zootermopsis nevadensis]
MTNVVATCAFGVNGNAIKNPESEFRRMGRNMIEPNYWKNVKITIILLVPWIADLFNLRFITRTVEDFFRRLVKEVVMYREQNKVTRADYLQYLINLKNKELDGDSINDHDFTPQKTSK